MTYDEFLRSAQDLQPPALSLPLLALWWDNKGDWMCAHQTVQQNETDVICAWVHAYLHRKEGDQWNADYWYRRARKPPSNASLEEEWRMIAQALLAR